MKILNKTHWRTADMKRILLKAAAMEIDEAKKRRGLHITVVYGGRGGGSSGCATIGGSWSTLRVSSDRFCEMDFAIVACHEFAHNRGAEHRTMQHYYKRGHDWGHPRYDWAKDPKYKVHRQPDRRTVAVAKRREARQPDKKLTHAQVMLKRATTKVKLATTLQKKWQYKVRYYERVAAARLAAPPPPPPPPPPPAPLFPPTLTMAAAYAMRRGLIPAPKDNVSLVAPAQKT